MARVAYPACLALANIFIDSHGRNSLFVHVLHLNLYEDHLPSGWSGRINRSSDSLDDMEATKWLRRKRNSPRNLSCGFCGKNCRYSEPQLMTVYFCSSANLKISRPKRRPLRNATGLSSLSPDGTPPGFRESSVTGMPTLMHPGVPSRVMNRNGACF